MSRDLLTLSNPKTDKGRKYGYLTAILHLAPAKLSGHNVCPSATPGCTAACLNTAGHGGIGLATRGDNSVQVARRRRTDYLFADRGGFLDQLEREIKRHLRRAEAADLTPCIRLNGTSDLRWETLAARGGTTILDRFPGLTFYDYTKRTDRRDLPPNYTLTFSLAETAKSWDDHLAALDLGLSVAVVLSGAGDSVRPRPFPAEWNGRQLVDGDLSDLRFLDPPSAYVGLRAKGRAKTDQTGFVYPVNRREDS
jgi:hypothetical protein